MALAGLWCGGRIRVVTLELFNSSYTMLKCMAAKFMTRIYTTVRLFFSIVSLDFVISALCAFQRAASVMCADIASAASFWPVQNVIALVFRV
jgi:hypothetical protein